MKNFQHQPDSLYLDVGYTVGKIHIPKKYVKAYDSTGAINSYRDLIAVR